MITTRSLVLVAFVVFVAALPASATDSQAASTAAVRSDFNGDGFADLAVGVPLEDVGSVVDAGGVNVVYGSSQGVTVAGNRFLRRGTPEVPGDPHTQDHFGAALASGDFDGDGFSDLAIGIPDMPKFGNSDEGTVLTLYGSPSGLARGQYWNIHSATAGATDECDCRFGAALAAGDFNGDGRDDLAIGMPKKDLARDGALVADVGAVVILRGYDFGLSAFSSRFTLITPENDDPWGLLGDKLPVVGGELGASLAAGDFDADTWDDLVIGAPGSRSIHVVFGSSGGVDVTTRRSGVAGVSVGADSRFGRVLAMGDVDGDGDQEVLAGDPLDDPEGVPDAGSVFVLHWSGLRTLRRKYTQGSLGVAREAGDHFGWALTAGDFNGDGRDDLAIGVPGEDAGSTVDLGIVHVLYSGLLGPDPQSSWTVSQGTAGVPGAYEARDKFGASLTACNLGKSRAADLAVGVPLEDFTAGGVTHTNAGVLDVLYGSSNGLTGTGSQDWSQASSGMAGVFEENDQFGSVLAC